MYVCMYVCMVCTVCLSVTGLRLKYTGLCIVMYLLARAARDAITRWCMAWRSRSRTRRIEDARTYPDVWITMTRNDLSVITQLADR